MTDYEHMAILGAFLVREAESKPTPSDACTQIHLVKTYIYKRAN